MYIFYTYADAEEMNRAKSHELLEAAVREWADETGSELDAKELMKTFMQEGNGKPFFELEGAPHFSISHSRDMWAVLIGSEPCGLDIQYRVAAKYDAIAKKYYDEADASAVLEAAPDEKAQAFFSAWTKREALVKAEGATVFSDASGLGVPGKWDVREVLLPGEVFAAVAVATDEEIVIRELQEA